MTIFEEWIKENHPKIFQRWQQLPEYIPTKYMGHVKKPSLQTFVEVNHKTVMNIYENMEDEE